MLSLPKLVASNRRVFWGWFFVIFGSFSFIGFFYAAVISKLLPASDNSVIRAIQNDWYYCFLVPPDTPNHFSCSLLPLAEYEVVQACMILLSQSSLGSSSSPH